MDGQQEQIFDAGLRTRRHRGDAEFVETYPGTILETAAPCRAIGHRLSVVNMRPFIYLTLLFMLCITSSASELIAEKSPDTFEEKDLGANIKKTRKIARTKYFRDK